MEDEAVRCDRCGRIVDGVPVELDTERSQTLCLGCAHPAYRGRWRAG